MAREKYPETGRLRQISGVGPVTSLQYVLTIGDPNRFAYSRDVGAYLGSTPRRRQSGDIDQQLRINKAGNRRLRSLLVQCAQYLLGRFGPDTDLKRWGARMTERAGKNAGHSRRGSQARGAFASALGHGRHLPPLAQRNRMVSGISASTSELMQYVVFAKQAGSWVEITDKPCSR